MCPRVVAEVKPLRDGCPKAREMGSGGSWKSQFTGRSTQDPQATAKERPAIPPDGIRAQIITMPLMLLVNLETRTTERNPILFSHYVFNPV